MINKTTTMMMMIAIVVMTGIVIGQSQISEYRSAVQGDSVHVGWVSGLLGTEQTFAASDCEVKFIGDKQGEPDTKLKVLDTDPNEPSPEKGAKPKVATYLHAEVGEKIGSFSYELKCKDIRGFGVLTVHQKGALIVDDSARIHLELSPETANKTSYYMIKGVQGDNLKAEIQTQSDKDYFNEFIGKFRYFKFYKRNPEGVVERILPKNFHKILPIRELNYRKARGLIDSKDLSIGLAVVHSDGRKVSYFNLESDADLGRIYVHIGDKIIDLKKTYELTHCFPVLKSGVLLRYYCTYESSEVGDALVYYDLSSTNEVLDALYFTDFKSIIAAKPMADDRTCLLVQTDASNREVICMDASKGFNKTKDNEVSYYRGSQLRLDRNEDCSMNFSRIDPDDFRFDEAAVFDCKNGTALASFVLGEKEVVETRSFLMIGKDVTPLCVNDRELAYLTDKNRSLVLQGGFNSPGQKIIHRLEAETTKISKIHCSQDSILILMDSSKKTHLLDIRRGDRNASLTRVNTFLDLPDRQTHMKVSSAHTAVLYSINKRGELTDIAEYNSFLGLIKLVNHQYTNPGSHQAVLVFSNNKTQKQISLQTDIVAEDVVTVEKKKILKDLTPGKEYDLREYFEIKGQVYVIEVVAPHPVSKNIYWYPDQIDFQNSKNDTASSARFLIEGRFVNTADRTVTNEDGSQVKIQGDLLNPSRYLGTLLLDQPLAIVAKQDGDKAFVQGWFIGKEGSVQNTSPIKLSCATSEGFLRDVREKRVGEKSFVVFYDKDGKGIGLEVEFDTHEKSYRFVSPEKVEIFDWIPENQVSKYLIKEVLPESGQDLTSCAHFTLEGGEIPSKWTYPVCNVTGGNSGSISIRNISVSNDSRTTFDLFNYPSKDSGLSVITWWRVRSNLVNKEGAAVHPAQFEYTVTLIRRFEGLKHHTISDIFVIDNSTVVVSKIESGDKKGIYEVYYGSSGNRPVIKARLPDQSETANTIDIRFLKVGGKLRRIFSRYNSDLNNMADVVFKSARLKLSNHTATVQVQNPFDIRFNKQTTLKSVFLYLEKYYPDDGKTDEDDKPKPKPEPEPPGPKEETRRSRLWYIAGIIVLIVFVGGLDLYFRKRHNEQLSDKSDIDRPMIGKPKKSMVKGNDTSSSINEL